jgi:elongation factor G
MGYPCVDITLILLDASYDELTASHFAYQSCAAMGFDELCRAANPILLEPIMALEIDAPAANMGEVVSSVTQRSGLVSGIENNGLNQIIKAEAPLAQLFGYAGVLRSLTQGRGSFSMSFAKFDLKTR